MSFQADSVVDQLYPRNLTSFVLPRQRFIDTFLGWDFNSDLWFVSAAGGGDNEMANTIDGGFEMTAGTSDNQFSLIDFNNMRPFSFTTSICIFICSRTVDTRNWCGLAGDGGGGANPSALMDNDSDQTFNALRTGSTSSTGRTNSANAADTSRMLGKITTGVAACTLHEDDLLTVTRTVDLPNEKLQCQIMVQNRNGGGAGKIASYHYMEAYNT